MAKAAKVKAATTSSPRKAQVASGKPQAGKVPASKAKPQAPKAVPVKSEGQPAPAKSEAVTAIPALAIAETPAKAKNSEPAAAKKASRTPVKKASSVESAPAKAQPIEPAVPVAPAARSKPGRVAKPKTALAAPATKSEPVSPTPPLAVAASRQHDAARPAQTKAGALAKPVSERNPAPQSRPAPDPKPAAATEAPAAAAAPKSKAKEEPTGADEMSFMAYLVRDPEAFARNIARMMEGAGKAAAAYMRPRESGAYRSDKGEELTAVFKTLANVGEYWMADPARAFDAQARLWTGYMDIWNRTLKRMGGEAVEPAIKPDARDRRFQDPEWSKNQFFDFIKQMYLMTTRWADQMVTDAEGLDEHTKLKAEFYIKQIADAAAPSNFVMTNPELLRETLAENGENLVRGMEMLAEDIAAGGGDLKIRQTSAGNFKIGENLATTPGKVIYQNDICQIIQYEPATAEVYKRPLLIVPPWINKFYILDLNADKSFIKWAVGQGRTVFVISWVNPDRRQAEKSFEQYMKEGILTGLDVIEKSTGERGVDTIGYCVGGTLLAVTLAWCAATGDDRIKSATFFTTQVDFTHAGELKAFVDEDQIRVLEESMKERGYLEGKKMSSSFNMLRPNDLIWPYFINNYMKGKEPFPFDLLYWNADATRMPAANHSFYLRNCYLDNNLSRGEMKIGGIKLDLSKVKIPVYNLAAREDHIAPARSVFVGSGLFGGPVEYVMSGSGHIAGVINPPAKGKYQFWTGGKPAGEFNAWVKSAKETPGSWWPHWANWVAALAPEKVPAREPGGGRLNAIEDAPGSYVKAKA